MTRLKNYCVIYIFFYCSPFFVEAIEDATVSSSLEFLRSFTLRNWETLISKQKNDKSRININDDEGGIEALGIDFVGGLLLLPVERSKCGAWDSCVLRCGDSLLGAPYLCSCDLDCLKYDDCCVDFKYYCGVPRNETSIFNSNSVPSCDDDEEFEILKEELLDDKNSQKEQQQSDIECVKIGHYDTNSYGFWYVNGVETDRKCIVKTPSWCLPGHYGAFEWDFTQSLSILLNFGPQGWNNDLLFSSDYYDPTRCPSVWEIWDPFTNTCRVISCNPEYVQENGKCVWDGDSPRPPVSDEFLRYHTRMANITFYGNILMDDSSTASVLSGLKSDIVDSLSQRIRINASRFSNVIVKQEENLRHSRLSSKTKTKMAGLLPVTVTEKKSLYGGEEDPLWISTEDGFPVVVNFTLQRKMQNSTHELTIEQFLSVLHEAVANRAVLLSNNVPMKINEVLKWVEQEEIDFFKRWCRGGDLLTYWNEDVEVLFVIRNSTGKIELDARVRETNKTYEQGHYVANLLFQSIDSNATATNISGVLVVCENRPYIVNETCLRISLNETTFDLQENGSLIYQGEIPGIGPRLSRDEYQFTDSGEVLTCINYDEAKNGGGLILEDPSVLEKVASCITMAVILLSLLGLLGTIVTYVLFSELRTLPGFCLIHLCIGEFVFYLLFIMGVRRSTAETDYLCTSIAIILHLSCLTFFAWSTVISYDLFQTFAKFQPVTRSRQKYLWRYALLGYGVPIVIVFSSVMVEFHSNLAIDYGTTGVCWIGNSMAAVYIFAIPIALSIISNAIFFILTVRGIRKVSKLCSSTNLGQKNRARFTLYARMSSIQCFAWIFGFLTVLTHFTDLLSTIFEFMFLTLSSLQGLYIFFAFVFNQRVLSLYKSMWSGKRGKRRGFDSDESIRDNSKKRTTIRRLSTIKIDESNTKINGHRVVSRCPKDSRTGHQAPAERTNSNETCVSYISSSSE